MPRTPQDSEGKSKEGLDFKTSIILSVFWNFFYFKNFFLLAEKRQNNNRFCNLSLLSKNPLESHISHSQLLKRLH